ncbi:unnamed protein product [Rotaria sp. Silwood1]|nr:unnamed protein product [Rotaria sp. Silwood1]CAF1458409.1 unnamed protein product [Rotaria sp. Silwood1]CAF3637642.1 unnamed protein product [Rotaria sp. Silwood1]CAF5061222.1 unnamed protein product [Rotaria sp. Silwood1]
MQSSDFSYKPTFSSYPDRRPVRIPSRHHSRPIIHIIESDSCSSISSYSPRHHHHHHHRRSYSHPRQRRFTQQQQQQPIILLPIKCQQSSTMTNSLQGQSQQNLLPTIQAQQRYILPSILNTNSTPDIINNNQSMFQLSMPRSFENLQQIQNGSIQYVQKAPDLQFISVKPHSSNASQHVLVNNTNKKQSNIIKPIQRSIITTNLP